MFREGNNIAPYFHWRTTVLWSGKDLKPKDGKFRMNNVGMSCSEIGMWLPSNSSADWLANRQTDEAKQIQASIWMTQGDL